MNPLPIDLASKIEPNFKSPSLVIKDFYSLDNILCQSRYKSVTISKEYLSILKNIRDQRGSKYNIICKIDEEGKSFGTAKIFQFKDIILTDGLEIGLSNRKVAETTNEIKAIRTFLQMGQKEFLVRWVINTKYGEEYMKNCAQALNRSDDKYEFLTLLIDSKEQSDIIKIVTKFRELLGKMTQLIKVKTELNYDLLKNQNLLFEFPVEKLLDYKPKVEKSSDDKPKVEKPSDELIKANF